MEAFNVGELKSKFSNILQRVEAGEEIIISFGKTKKNSSSGSLR
jgi:antitoxin (DNA-binding transcriptional repressor) of toxin-antitoxin stability system